MYELFEYAPESLILISADFKVKRFNMKAKDIFGPMLVEGTNLTSFELLNADNENICKIKSYFDVAFDNREINFAKSDSFVMTFLLSHRITFFDSHEMHYLSFKNITDVVSSKKLFEQLYDNLSVKTMELANTIAEKDEAYKMLKLKDDEMLYQLNLARQVQNSIFQDMNSTVGDYYFTSRMIPASIISGDILTSYRREDYIDFVIADVTGHGVPAALITMMLQMSFQTRTAECADIDKVVSRINSDMYTALSASNIYMTMLFGRLHFKTGKLELANCGHPQPLVLHKDGSSFMPDIKGMMLGVLDTIDCGFAEIDLTNGDTVVFYSDGILEAYPKDAKYNFYESRFFEKMNLLTSEERLDVPSVILEDIYNFVGARELPDDATVFCINVK